MRNCTRHGTSSSSPLLFHCSHWRHSPWTSMKVMMVMTMTMIMMTMMTIMMTMMIAGGVCVEISSLSIIMDSIKTDLIIVTTIIIIVLASWSPPWLWSSFKPGIGRPGIGIPPSPGTGICEHDDHDDEDECGDGHDDVEYQPRQDEPPSVPARPSLGSGNLLTHCHGLMVIRTMMMLMIMVTIIIMMMMIMIKATWSSWMDVWSFLPPASQYGWE